MGICPPGLDKKDRTASALTPHPVDGFAQQAQVLVGALGGPRQAS